MQKVLSNACVFDLRFIEITQKKVQIRLFKQEIKDTYTQKNGTADTGV